MQSTSTVDVEGATPAAPTYRSLQVLATEFARAAATKPSAIRRQVVELLPATHQAAPDDPS
ncbi:hypothetical protein GS831_14050 [Rhodococcus hoagii]|nr:hypothetical protein [Prescottella equi]